MLSIKSRQKGVQILSKQGLVVEGSQDANLHIYISAAFE